MVRLKHLVTPATSSEKSKRLEGLKTDETARAAYQRLRHGDKNPATERGNLIGPEKATGSVLSTV